MSDPLSSFLSSGIPSLRFACCFFFFLSICFTRTHCSNNNYSHLLTTFFQAPNRYYFISLPLQSYGELPRRFSGEGSACQCRTPRRFGFNPWVRKWKPTSVFFPRRSHGQKILVGYSPWGCKESGMTEQKSMCAHARAHTHTHAHTHTVLWGSFYCTPIYRK